MKHLDKDGKTLHTGDLVHFEVDGHPYTGIVHALVRRDHEPAVLTLVQLFLPALEVAKQMPKHQDAGDEAPHAHDDPAKPIAQDTQQTDPGVYNHPSIEKKQQQLAREPRHSDQQQPKPADVNRGSTQAEPKKGSK